MKIFIIGTGNVATRLGKALLQAGHSFTGVFGRDAVKAKKLSTPLGCHSFTEIISIPAVSDVYLIAIKDDAIAAVAAQMPKVKGIVAHTSGASPLSLLNKFPSRGVFYPVETITAKYPRSFRKVPVCVEGSDEKTLSKLLLLAKSISEEIYTLDSTQRARLHVAAVFTNNFPNYLMGIGNALLEKEHLPPSLLKALALSTVRNVFENGAQHSQTGPAVRNDVKTIQHHLEMLKSDPQYQAVYKLLTNQITAVHKKKK